MRKRTHTRGIAFALAVHWTSVLLVAYMGAELTRNLAEARGVPNPLDTGPFEVYSAGWYLSQVAAIAVTCASGWVCAFFAPPDTWRAPLVLTVLYLVLGLLDTPPATGWAFGAYWVLVSPISIWLGVLARRRMERAGAI